jgi:hypothetical protein
MHGVTMKKTITAHLKVLSSTSLYGLRQTTTFSQKDPARIYTHDIVANVWDITLYKQTQKQKTETVGSY